MKVRIDENLNVFLTYGGKEHEMDLAKSVNIDENNLNQEFSVQPASYAWWSSTLEQAQHQYRQAQAQFEFWEAQAGKLIRETLGKPSADGKVSRPTEAKISTELKGDPKWLEEKNKVLEARYAAELLKVIVKSVEQKGSMLISVGANVRQEQDFEGMRINRRRKP